MYREYFRVLQGRRLPHHNLSQPVLPQQLCYGFESLIQIVYVDHHLLNLWPVLGLDAPEDVQLGLLGVDLEQIDAIDPVVAQKL
jgi:hypothetical protein